MEYGFTGGTQIPSYLDPSPAPLSWNRVAECVHKLRNETTPVSSVSCMLNQLLLVHFAIHAKAPKGYFSVGWRL